MNKVIRMVLIIISLICMMNVMVLNGSGEPRYYHVVDLGTFGGVSSGAHGINNNGQVVGYSTVNP